MVINAIRHIQEANMVHTTMEKSGQITFRDISISVVWFVVLSVVAYIATGAIIGTFTGASTTDYAAAHTAGWAASEAFFARYWPLFLAGTASFTAALYWRGVLPGTSRPRKIT
jgi:hypothetical protein